jgi:hypothetical protein
MKTLLVFLLMSVTLVNSTLANGEKYVQAMQKSIQSLYDAETTADIQQAVNAIERIGSAEKKQWAPYYYAAFGYVRLAFKETDGAKKDALLDLAKANQEQADALKKDDSEIIAMAGFIMMIRITVDPATRGPQYAGLVMQTYQTALALNPNNPRALCLLANMQLGTAQFFHQPATEACGNAAKALTLFESDKAEDLLAPKWGKKMTAEVLVGCN